MAKYVFPNLISSNLLIGSSFLLTYFYSTNIIEVYNFNNKEDSYGFTKLKLIYSDPLFSLQLILLIYELFYFLIYFIFNNKLLVNYLGLGIDNIATQNNTDISNIVMEFFFSFLIKGLAIAFSIFYLIKCYNEIDRKIEEVQQTPTMDLLKSASRELLIIGLINILYFLLYVGLYITKFVRGKI